MDPQVPVKIGTLASSCGRDQQDWRNHFYVLYSDSKTNKARIDWFPDEAAFKNSPLVRKTIFIEEMKKVKSTNIDGKSNGFLIETLRRKEPFLFSASDKKDMKTWVDQLNKLLNQRRANPHAKNPLGGDSHLGDGVYGNELWSFDEQPVEFKVTVGETDSALACNISNKEHLLQVYSHSLALKDGKTSITLYVWPYKYIRRYGRSRSSFTFEAGRRCASGEGVFTVYTSQGEEIFEEVQRGNSPSVSSPIVPELPSRAYGSNFGEVMAMKPYQKLNTLTSNKLLSDYKRLEKPAPLVPAAPSVKGEFSPSAAGGDRAGPPLPKLGRSQVRNMQPLPPSGKVPISQTYVEPHIMNPYDETYSSIGDDNIHTAANLVTSDEGYSTPVLEDNSMASLAAQVRMSTDRNKMSNGDDEYDEVRLNVMMKVSNKPDTPEPQVYGQLYGQPIKKQTKPVQHVSDDYDVVRNT